MKENKRLKLTTIQSLTHYGIVIFLLLIVALLGWSLIEIYVTGTYTGVRSTGDLVKVSLPFLLLAITFAFIQHRRLRFKEFSLIYSEEQFQDAVQRTIHDLGWRVENNSENFFRAVRPWNWTGSWGEMVTIIKDKDRLLINSICDPDHFSSAASYGWNRKNINTFIKNLNDVLRNQPEEIRIEEPVNESSSRRTLIRFVAYPFCIFLIILGVDMILEPLTIRTALSGIGAVTVATIYLYSDIKLLSEGMKKKSPNR